VDIQLKEVKTLRDLRTFAKFPLQLYRGHPYYVPTLISDDINTLRRDKNPAFDFCEARYWLAYREGRVAGRIAAIYNPHHAEHWGQPYLRFGWIDFVDDPAVSAALLGAVEGWAREKGLIAVHGPLGFTDLDREGMLVEGFDELGTLATSYNYAYYPTHLEHLGYAKDVDWVEYQITVPDAPDERIARIADVVLRRYHLRKLQVSKKSELLGYAHQALRMVNDEYQHLYGVTPLTDKQVAAYVKQYFGFLNPVFTPAVLDEHDRMVAFGVTMPSLSKALQKGRGQLFPLGLVHLLKALRRNDRADLYLVAVRSDYQGKGVNAVLMDMMTRVFIERGIHLVESNPELETNADVQGQWKYYEKRQHKRRHCYIKHLEGL
jgi:ribosomal protein S18 acetylase RimI-like enzyme